MSQQAIKQGGAKPSKDSVAELLIDWHFRVEPGMEQILRIVSQTEDEPDEPIKLLEVSRDTFNTGRVDTLTFAASGDITYPSRVAIVTPEEYVAIRNGSIPMPKDWDISTAKHFARPTVKRARRKK
jgi:hypothetical protein